VACPAGKPADGLIAEADRIGATLIVVGNKRMKGMSRLLGAVAKSQLK
jgi:nucleotide-binding universal stress UspA family protein